MKIIVEYPFSIRQVNDSTIEIKMVPCNTPMFNPHWREGLEKVLGGTDAEKFVAKAEVIVWRRLAKDAAKVVIVHEELP